MAASERAIRPIALGGKDYFLLVQTPDDGVWRSSVPSVAAAARACKPTPGSSSTAKFHRRVARTS